MKFNRKSKEQKAAEQADKLRMKQSQLVAQRVLARIASEVANMDLSSDTLGNQLESVASDVIGDMLDGDVMFSNRLEVLGLVVRPFKLIHEEIEKRSGMTTPLVLAKVLGKQVENITYRDIDVILRDENLQGGKGGYFSK